MPQQEVKSVELAELKAGIALDPGHFVVLVVKDVHGKKSFAVTIQLKAAGGTPLAHERVRLHDPDTGEPVGDAVTTDENGVLHAEVPEEKDYHVMIENEAGEEEELPSFEIDPEGEEKTEPEHWTLSVALVDAARAPLKGETVEVTGADGTKLTLTTDDEGCIHELADLGVYQLAVRGKTFSAHTILHEDRQDTAAAYRFVVA